MKTTLRVVASLVLIGIAGILFVVYLATNELSESASYRHYDWSGESELKSKNYSSRKQAEGQIEFVYEQRAEVKTQSAKFEKDSETVIEIVEEHEGLVQSEFSRGLSGERTTEWVFTVHPEQFEVLVKALEQVGELTDFSKNQVDRTAEYRALESRISLLQGQLAAMEELAKEGGSIEEKIQLTDRLFTLREQISKLGVELDDFVGDEPQSTVHFFLHETEQKQEKDWSFLLWFALLFLVLTFVPWVAGRKTA